MGKIKSYFICAIFCFSFLGVGFSQSIILKSGQKIEGEIVEQTDNYVKLEFQGVELTFYADEISSINQTSSAGSNTLTPQMELLYKGYLASLDALPGAKNEEAKEEAGERIEPFVSEKAEMDQTASSCQLDLH